MMRQILIQWLLDNGYAEENAGYGHVDAATLADALIKEFNLTTRYPENHPHDFRAWPGDYWCSLCAEDSDHPIHQ